MRATLVSFLPFTLMSPRSVVILAPNGYGRFIGNPSSTQFQVRTANDHPASLLHLLLLFNPVGTRLPAPSPVNPMAGYYLESFLKQRGYDARTVFEWDDDTRLTEAMTSDPLAVLLSTTYITNPTLLSSALRAVRQVAPGVPIIVGGPYIWKQKYEYVRNQRAVPLTFKGLAVTSRAEALRTFNVDVEADALFSDVHRASADDPLRDALYVAHEFGEYSLLRLLQAIEQGHHTPTTLTDVPNLVLPLANGTWLHTPHAHDPIDLDTDFTRWDLVQDMPTAMVPVRTSVGCPFKCRYCDFIELHPEVRERSPESIKEEILQAKQRGAVHFNFIDDNIFLTKARLKELTTTIVKHELDVKWGGFFRVDRVDEDNIGDLKESGCTFGFCGIESGDREQLRRMRKGCREDQAHRGINLSTEAGISLVMTFIVGYPGETRESIDNTLSFINGLSTSNAGALTYQLFPFFLLPATAVDDPEYRADMQLLGRGAGWSHSTMNAEEVERVWMPYFFRHANLSYTYANLTFENLRSIDKRNAAVEKRRELTLAFIDRESDDTIQRIFADLYALLRLKPAAQVPGWQGYFASREQQPGMNSFSRGL